MISFTLTLFGIALISLITLLVLKRWEVRHTRVLLPTMRMRADEAALRLKGYLLRMNIKLAHIPPILLLAARYWVREAMINFANTAHLVASQAHRLADLLSHKHKFERREPQSEFLKQVTEYKETLPTHLDR